MNYLMFKIFCNIYLQLSEAIERGKKHRDKDNGSRSSTPTNFTKETDYEMVHVTVTEAESDA